MTLEEFWKRDRTKQALDANVSSEYRKVDAILNHMASGQVDPRDLKMLARKAREAFIEYGRAIQKRDGKHPGQN